MSSFKMTSFAEWMMLLFFVLLLVREIFVIYKSNKKAPRARRFCSDDHIAVYLISAVVGDGSFDDSISDDGGIG